MGKSKIPLALRLVQRFFPLVEFLSARLAVRWFRRLFFSPFRYPWPAKELAVRDRAVTSTLVIDNKRIFIYRWGVGPAVLAVHGWAGRGTQFRKWIEPFCEAGFSVVAFDGPAHGQSEGRSTEIIEFASVIRTIYEKENAVAIVAHSFGGVASLFAMAEGLKNEALVMVASPTIGDEVINTYLRAVNGSQRVGELFKDFVFKKTGKHFDDFSALRIIHRVPAPPHLLVVYDTHDVEVTPLHARRLKEEFPAATLLETQDLGHNRILKDDEVIARAVTFVRIHTSIEH